MSKLKSITQLLLHKKTSVFLSGLLGINLAFYFSIYLKTDVIPLGSTRFLAFTLLVAGLASLLYLGLLLWAKRGYSTSSWKLRLLAVFLSLVFGTLLFFTTTGQWLKPMFYVRATLPISYELFVPWYASTGMAFFVGSVFFATIVFFILAFLSPTKHFLWQELNVKIAPFSFSTKSDGWLIAVFVLLAFLLRVINLEVFPPHLEEFNHLNAAKDLLSGIPKDVVYQRSYYTVTLPVKLSFSLFGMSVWVARLPGILLNSLAIIPLYLLARKLNKPLAILSAILYITSPWVLNLSRIIREYAYYPFFFYGTLYLLVNLLENIPRNFQIVEWRSLFRKRVFLDIFLLTLPVIYALGIDSSSTAKVVGLAYLVFPLFAFFRFDRKNKKNIIFFACMALLLIVFRLLTQFTPVLAFRDHLSVADPLRSLKNGNAIFLLRQFFFNPPTQWYYARILLFPIGSLFFAFVWGFKLRYKNIIPLYLAVLYAFSILVFLLFYDFTYASRFFLHIQLWYIPLLAFGMYGWYLVVDLRIKNKMLKSALLLLIVFGSFNFRQFFVHAIPGEASVTSSVHMNFDHIDALISDKLTPNDVLLSKYYGRYVKFHDAPSFAAIYEDTYDLNLIKAYNSGWLVVDELRYWVYDKSLLQKNFSVDGIKFKYMGEFPDPTSGLSNFVWHWDKMQ